MTLVQKAEKFFSMLPPGHRTLAEIQMLDDAALGPKFADINPEFGRAWYSWRSLRETIVMF